MRIGSFQTFSQQSFLLDWSEGGRSKWVEITEPPQIKDIPFGSCCDYPAQSAVLPQTSEVCKYVK
jgi:hypothetical protein